jgi:hypothetical protein
MALTGNIFLPTAHWQGQRRAGTVNYLIQHKYLLLHILTRDASDGD